MFLCLLNSIRLFLLMQLPRNWMHLHFLRAIGVAMSMRAGIAADAAAALLFRILSQPALLFPPLRQVEGVEVQHESSGGYISCYRKQVQSVQFSHFLYFLFLQHNLTPTHYVCTFYEFSCLKYSYSINPKICLAR